MSRLAVFEARVLVLVLSKELAHEAITARVLVERLVHYDRGSCVKKQRLEAVGTMG